MEEKEFNLIDEPWIKVLDSALNVKEVSLQNLIEHANEYIDFANETKLVDTAILRTVLALIHTVVVPEVLEDGDDALDLWKNLWKAGRFPVDKFNKYFSEWEDRFYLFHPKYPFMQIPKLKPDLKGKKDKKVVEDPHNNQSTLFELNPLTLESNNKSNMFSMTYSGDHLSVNKKKQDNGTFHMTYAETARGLIHLYNYSDCSGKPSKLNNEMEKGEKLPQMGSAWLGKLGAIVIKGNNLFETLMLNLVLLKDGNEVWLEKNLPIWEKDSTDYREGHLIKMPSNQAEILTMPYRHIHLQRNTNGEVVGFEYVNGDYVNRVEAFNEQMTLWKKGEKEGITPKRLTHEFHSWEELSSPRMSSVVKPGIVSWLDAIFKDNEEIANKEIGMMFASIGYYNKDNKYEDIVADELNINIGVLEEKSPKVSLIIGWEITKCQMIGDAVFRFVKNLNKDNKNANDIAAVDKQKFFHAVDTAAKEWIAFVTPDISDDEFKESVRTWRRTAIQAAKNTIGIYIKDLPVDSLFADRCPIAKYYLLFEEDLKKIYGWKDNKKGDEKQACLDGKHECSNQETASV